MPCDEHPVEFAVNCTRCKLILDFICESKDEVSTNQLYTAFQNREHGLTMSHRTVDKHVKELTDNGFLRRFVNSKTGQVKLFVDVFNIYISMVSREPELIKTLAQKSKYFLYQYVESRPEWTYKLAYDCPKCGHSRIMPKYDRFVSDEDNSTILTSVKWNCPSCEYERLEYW